MTTKANRQPTGPSAAQPPRRIGPVKELVMSGGDVRAADRLAAILAQYTVVKHVHSEMACGPDMAKAMLERNFGNRPLREGRTRTIAADMVAGRFMEKQPHPICFDIDGVLRDGQHRLSAVVLSGCTVWLTFCFGCDPAERDYYDQGIPRSVADIAKEHGQQNAKLASALVVLILRVEQQSAQNYGRKEQTERLDRLFGEDPHFEAAIKASGRLRGLLTQAAGALAYWHIASNTAHHDKLEMFLEGLQTGAGLREGGPVLRVRDELLARKHLKTTGRETNVKNAASLVLAWNAMLERRKPRHFDWIEAIGLPEVV